MQNRQGFIVWLPTRIIADRDVIRCGDYKDVPSRTADRDVIRYGDYKDVPSRTADRGFGTAVTLEAIRVAKDAGLPNMILHASDMGFPVYKKLGFQEYQSISFYSLSD